LIPVSGNLEGLGIQNREAVDLIANLAWQVAEADRILGCFDTLSVHVWGCLIGALLELQRSRSLVHLWAMQRAEGDGLCVGSFEEKLEVALGHLGHPKRHRLR
jgi:hypothetical protein